MQQFDSRQWQRIKPVEKCHVCFKEPNDPENRKAGDRYHYTCLYRGTAHNNCNLKYRIPDHIPITFYILSAYETKKKTKNFEKDNIGVTLENKENHFSCQDFKFNQKQPSRGVL